MSQDLPPQEVLSSLSQDNNKLLQAIEELKGVKRRLVGTWSVIYNSSGAVNAFVSDYCPRKVFVNEGFIKVMKPSDEELAVVLFHEVSHFLMGHTITAQKNAGLILGIELAILTFIDPIGLYSIMFEYLADTFANCFIKGYSRAHEEEADYLGLTLMANSKYDITKGVNIFLKFVLTENEKGDSVVIDHSSSGGSSGSSGSGGSKSNDGAKERGVSKPTDTLTTNNNNNYDSSNNNSNKEVALLENQSFKLEKYERHAGWDESHPSSYDRFIRLR